MIYGDLSCLSSYASICTPRQRTEWKPPLLEISSRTTFSIRRLPRRVHKISFVALFGGLTERFQGTSRYAASRIYTVNLSTEANAIQVRYADLMFVSRIYRYLQMIKRSGCAHGIKLPGRETVDLTVPCPMCLWPGVNLPANWRLTEKHLK